MPKRLNVVKVDSTEVQGDDSWVKVRKLTVREMRELIKKTDTELSTVEQFDAACRMYFTHVVEWNWVWDDGKVMPQPSEDAKVLEDLTNVEVTFLGNAMTGEGPAAKNLPSG